MRRAAETALEDQSDAPTEVLDPNAPVVFPTENADPADADPADIPLLTEEGTTRSPAAAAKSSEAPAAAGESSGSLAAAATAAADRSAQEAKVTEREALFKRVRPDLAQKIVVDERILPASREQYRKLATVLHHAQETSGLKVVMIASAVAGEGKTLTASNLALTLSESYRRRVLLVDADLRKPMLDKLFQIDAPTGLGEGLVSTQDRRLPLHEVSDWLTVLPSGQPSTDPMAALSSPRMRRVLDEARRSFDWVIIDTPPVGLLTDASLLAAMVDGAVMVVKAESTPFELVQRAAQSIGDDRLLGVVLNRSMTPDHSGGYGGYGYGEYAHAQPATGAPDGTS
jgi:capsular exopolysaccharide synthesis family protein